MFSDLAKMLSPHVISATSQPPDYQCFLEFSTAALFYQMDFIIKMDSYETL